MTASSNADVGLPPLRGGWFLIEGVNPHLFMPWPSYANKTVCGIQVAEGVVLIEEPESPRTDRSVLDAFLEEAFADLNAGGERRRALLERVAAAVSRRCLDCQDWEKQMNDARYG